MATRDTTNKTITEHGNFKKLYRKKYGDIASVTGRKLFTPEQLFNLAVAYFEWAEQNQIKAAETASFQGEVTESLVHKTRIFTVTGLCLFCGVTQGALAKWRKEEGYSEVMEFVDSVIFEQKYQLAANGVINASFIGKELGIDKPTTISVETSASASATAEMTVEQQMSEAVNSVLDNL